MLSQPQPEVISSFAYHHDHALGRKDSGVAARHPRELDALAFCIVNGEQLLPQQFWLNGLIRQDNMGHLSDPRLGKGDRSDPSPFLTAHYWATTLVLKGAL